MKKEWEKKGHQSMQLLVGISTEAKQQNCKRYATNRMCRIQTRLFVGSAIARYCTFFFVLKIKKKQK
jgi:hypothetical protein